MHQSKELMDNKKFYTALGQLVYSVAKADGTVQNEETAKVFHFVVSQFLEHELATLNGRSGLEAFYTEKEFNRLRSENESCQDAFTKFETFYKQHKNSFDDNMKNTCLSIIESVANAHKGIDQCETTLIEKIKAMFVEE